MAKKDDDKKMDIGMWGAVMEAAATMEAGRSRNRKCCCSRGFPLPLLSQSLYLSHCQYRSDKNLTAENPHAYRAC
jgi:hypothetical protein